MTIYLVRRTDYPEFDEYEAHVIVAEDGDQARQLAKEIAALDGYAEDPAVWTKALVTEVQPTGGPRVVLSDFKRG